MYEPARPVAIMIIGTSQTKIKMIKIIDMITVKRTGLILLAISGTKAIRIAVKP